MTKTNFLFFMNTSCDSVQDVLILDVYETSAAGNKFTKIQNFTHNEISENSITNVTLFPHQKKQKITGFGGSFTEASAHLLNRISKKNRDLIIEAYFGETGAKYSLTRTHMNSCDFSLSQYSFAPVAGDKELDHFSIEHDQAEIIPMIKSAMKVSKEGFKILSSPWTAPPWMKDNGDWVGGKLLPEYYDTWALFFSKYVAAYKEQDIDIWGFTVENEPLGNGNNWESMHFTPQEMTNFVINYLGPTLKTDFPTVKILGYDQNKEHLKEWVDAQYKNEETSKYFDGTAIHWYASTFHYFPEELQYAHQKAPEKFLIQSEACVDAQVPRWFDDDWYWSKEATDWGFTWASDEHKYMHPEYAPVYRYAREIIGCLNNWVDGWIDWNMVLDTQGGPNWFQNWCVAPVIVDPEKDEVYFTPIYYALLHFSKFIRPNASVIHVESSDESLMITATENPDGSIAVVLFNEQEFPKNIRLVLGERKVVIPLSGKSIQSIIIPKHKY